jgi:hypothetical protein
MNRFATEPDLMTNVNEEHLGGEFVDACNVEIIPNLEVPSYLSMMVQLNSPYAEILDYQ